MNHYYVYLLLDPTDYFKPFYVGKGSGERMFSHLQESSRGENSFKDNKIAKIRKAGFEPVPMKWRIDLLEDDAYDIETSLIQRFGRRGIDPDGILTNICMDARPPSGLGRECSEKTRKKIGDKQRGELNHRFGKSFTEEQRTSRSAHFKELGFKPPVNFGPMSEERKKAISDGRRGVKLSAEICAKLSEQRKGRKRKPHTAETIEKIRQANIETARLKKAKQNSGDSL